MVQLHCYKGKELVKIENRNIRKSHTQSHYDLQMKNITMWNTIIYFTIQFRQISLRKTEKKKKKINIIQKLLRRSKRTLATRSIIVVRWLVDAFRSHINYL